MPRTPARKAKDVSLSPAREAVLEEIAQRMAKYMDLFKEKSDEFKKDPVEGRAAYHRIKHGWWRVAKDGQQWMPTADRAKTYQASMEEVCNMDATTLEDHVKISFAAYGMFMSIMEYDIGLLPEAEQFKVNGRVDEIRDVAREKAMRSNPTPKTLADRLLSTTPARSVLSTFSPQTVTPNVIGKRFELTMLSDVMVYEVIGMQSAKGQATTYTIQYEGDGDLVIEEGLKHEDLIDMLEFSRPLDEVLEMAD